VFHLLSQETSQETNSFLATDIIGERFEDLIGQDSAVAAQDDPCIRGVLSNELDHATNLVKSGNNKIDTHIVIFVDFQFPDQFPFRWVMKDHAWKLDVFGQVIDCPTTNYLAQAENALGASDLSVKKLGTYRIAFSGTTEGTTH